MVRHIGTEMTVLKEELCYTHRSLETGGRDPVQDHTGKHRNQSSQRKGGGNVRKSLYCGFCGKEWARQGKQV